MAFVGQVAGLMSREKKILRKWYLVYSKPRQETVAKVNLERQGYETYLPLMRAPRRRKGKMVSVVAPMFPRYLFIHLNSETDNWAPIRSTLGVVSVVRFGRDPSEVPDKLIAVLRGREDDTGIHVLPPDEYKAGARVRITQGGFAGYEGIFHSANSRQRVTVLLDLLGRRAQVHVDTDFIEPAS
ncbi:MAG: transcription/translation regulatory transformer protein RfaH [Proteobacteria bacterium]|nr:transcription/translation regulatory transformer protein RfaH [Pseudomonadota bacterium]